MIDKVHNDTRITIRAVIKRLDILKEFDKISQIKAIKRNITHAFPNNHIIYLKEMHILIVDLIILRL